MYRGEISRPALAAAVRYGVYDDVDIYNDVTGAQTIKWIRVRAVWRSKRRFHLSHNMDELVAIFASDTTRYSLWEHSDSSLWVRAL